MCRTWEIVYGVVYSIQKLSWPVDVYIGAWDQFESSGAADFLQTFHVGNVSKLDTFWNRSSDYQVVVWTDILGWELKDRRTTGPRGEST